MAKLLQTHIIDATGALDRGLKTAAFAVLRQTTMPAALVEMAFISNATEEQRLRSAEYQRTVAGAIAGAITEYFGVAAQPEPKPAPMTDYAGHWAETTIEKVKILGLMSGDPDGKFRPDDPVTRAELATALLLLHQRLV